MPIKTTPFDAADYLTNTEDRAEYLNAVLTECDGDPAMVLSALGDIARSVGITDLATKTGITRQGLSKSLRPRAISPVAGPGGRDRIDSCLRRGCELLGRCRPG